MSGDYSDVLGGDFVIGGLFPSSHWFYSLSRDGTCYKYIPNKKLCILITISIWYFIYLNYYKIKKNLQLFSSQQETVQLAATQFLQTEQLIYFVCNLLLLLKLHEMEQ